MSQSSKQSKLKKLFRYAADKNYRFLINAGHHKYDQMPDEEFLKKRYRTSFGKELDLVNPVTFNEKLQWLKLYDRNPAYSMMVDKYAVRQYIADTIGEEYLIPLLGVWDDPDDIDFDALPDQFVLKCNHNSGLGMYICKDKSQMDIEAVKTGLRKGLKENYFYPLREWPYQNVKHRIIAEQYMEDPILHELRDYKFFCFNGQVKCFKIDFDRFIDHRANYYSPDGTLLTLGEVVCPPKYDKELTLPGQLAEMIRLAEKLSADLSFLRVDFYEVNGKIFFGELTFFPASGFGPFTMSEWDTTLGSWIHLPPKKDEC